MSAAPKYNGEDRKELQKILRDNGFRSTEGRLALLSVLKRSHRPLPVAKLARRVGTRLDEVNVYRALEAMTDKGLLARSDLRRGGARYEYAHSHHHHLVCNDCGLTEDVEVCAGKRMENTVLSNSRAFAKVNTHALEFFGRCHACATQ